MLKKLTTILLSILMLLFGTIGLTACKITPQDTYYTVTFELNGGSIEGKDLTESVSIKENTVINFSEYVPTKTDYSFDGWLLGETLYTTTDTFTVTEDVTFSAQWTDLVAEALANAKTTAKATLETYVNADDYRLAEQEELATAIANGKSAIDNATDVAGVETALANAKTVIDEIKTDAELTAEETAQALTNAKTTAKTALETYVNADDYRLAEQEELATAIANGKTAIDNATDVAGVETALASAKTVIDEIKTDAELTAEETVQALANAKTTAKATLETYVNAEDYRTAEQEELATAIANGKSAIDNATDVAGVETALANAKTVIDEIKTDAELTAEEAAQALANAKTTAKASLETYVNAGDYRLAEQEELATAIANGKTAIDNATDVTGVETALTNAKSVIDNIETDAQITAKEPTITTTLSNGAVFTNTKATIDVWAKTATGIKLNTANVSVMVNDVEMSVNWDDSEKTSYNFVFVEGENTVVITAVDGAYTKTVSYTVTCNLSAPTTITVAVEGFSIGIGYIVAPYTLVLDEQTLAEMASMYEYASAEDMKENLTAAYVLDYVLQINGLEMDYQGSLSSGGGFYMCALSGLDTSNIAVPEELYAKLEENGYYPEEYVYEEGTLGEFDITWGSGWMYAVNGVFPNVGFCDYIPQDGDVMRIQFTLAYGADVGTTMVGDVWFEQVNRDDLTVLIGKALEVGVDITDALETISTFGVTQDDIDTACQTLETAIKAKNNE
ncbi:MAG: InlB B-repeat-containing protein [Clostridia bacterium]|nr:InlB B-repeat-containing protein [Clostridia bacterium]